MTENKKPKVALVEGSPTGRSTAMWETSRRNYGVEHIVVPLIPTKTAEAFLRGDEARTVLFELDRQRECVPLEPARRVDYAALERQALAAQLSVRFPPLLRELSEVDFAAAMAAMRRFDETFAKGLSCLRRRPLPVRLAQPFRLKRLWDSAGGVR